MRIGRNRRAAHARRIRKRDDGQALVEMALALPLLLLLLVGIFEFARAYSIKQTVVNAAREGARQAVLQGASSDSALSVINRYLASNNIATTDPPTRISITDPDAAGGVVTVLVETQYTFLLMGPVISLIGSDFADGVTLGSQTTMRHE